MKLIQIAIVAYVISYVFTVSCVSTNYCMGCHATTANQCVSCFNWGTGSVGARALNSSASPANCQTALHAAVKVSDTKVYSGSITTAGTAAVGNVALCKKDFKNWVASSSSLTCSDTAITMGVTCSKISDCETTTCFDTASGTDSVACTMCKKGKSGSTYDSTNSQGSTNCTSYSGIANCDYFMMTGASTHTCYACKSKYAVANNDASCVSYTTDSNCRKLQSGNVNCRECWDAYYWNTNKCKLYGSVIIAGILSVLAFVM